MEAPEQVLVSLFKRLHHNLLKGYADKCNFLVSNDEEVTLNVYTFALKNCECEKLLRVWFKLILHQFIQICEEGLAGR